MWRAIKLDTPEFAIMFDKSIKYKVEKIILHKAS